MKIIGAFDMVYTLLEFLCYAFIYNHVYKHNRYIHGKFVGIEERLGGNFSENMVKSRAP